MPRPRKKEIVLEIQDNPPAQTPENPPADPPSDPPAEKPQEIPPVPPAPVEEKQKPKTVLERLKRWI
jgi:hypothetical protein